MSILENIWTYIRNWWYRTGSKHDVVIDQVPKEKVFIGIGGSTKFSANVTTSCPKLVIEWQKVTGNISTNIRTDSIKYSGSSCSMPTPELVINDVDHTDDGVYHLSVTTDTETVTGPKVVLNVFGDPVISLSKEERNFLRYYCLCQTKATESAQLYFTRKVPESTLAAHLNSHKTNLKFSHWKCTSDQITALFPAAPVIAQSCNFDFTLLYKLIRNTLSPCSTPTQGWGPKPLPGDTKEEDDIERIRHHRNLLAHNTEFKLNNSDFNDMWTDLSQAVVRLSLGSLYVDVVKLSKQKLEQQLKNEIFENLKNGIESMKDEINIIHQDMQECRERIQMIEDTHIPPNIRQTHLNTIKVWKQDDELYYDTTNVYQTTKDLINSCPVVTLVGGPGCGKTATARHIALQYEQNGWEIVPVLKAEDIVLYGDSRLRQMFVLDDILGVFAVDMSLYNNVNNHREGIMNAISNESKLLFTCRKSVYNEAINLKPFVLTVIVDLQSEENILNEFEKENILAKHCRHKGVPENIYSDLAISQSFPMFPLLCKIFSATYKNHGSVDIFFANPFDCFIDELNRLEHSTPKHYAALVLCVLSNNMLAFNKITVDDNKMKPDAYNTCGVNLGTSDKLIQNALSYLVGTYLSENENNFTFIHDAIFEIVAYHYGQKNPLMIIKYMKSNFISSKVTVYNRYDCTADYSILIDEEYYEQLAERLYTDLQSFEMIDVFMNKSLRYLPFLKIFVKTLMRKPYNELKALICQVQATSEIINIYSHHDRKTEMNENKYKELSTQNLPKKNVCSFGRELHNPRIISLIIYYGHTNLLTSIVSLVHEHNDSTDIVFGSDITEQTQLLILGCYSGELEMVDSILKYVQNGCINRTSLITTLYCVEDKMSVTYVKKNRKYTPLTIACQLGNLSIVQILLREGANIDQCGESTRFPLLNASEQGHYDVVEYLVQHGCNVNLCNIYTETSLQRASYYGHYNVVKYLVQHGASINQCNGNNKSPLCNASEGGHKAIVEFLIENGADINQCTNEYGYMSNESPLHKACQKGHTTVVKYLVENGADINTDTTSPLCEACEGGYKDIVEFLVKKGCDINQCNAYSNSPLYEASFEGHQVVVEFLVEKGANINQCNKDNESPLYRASAGGYTSIVEFMVDKGANVNQCSTDNKSPLYKACKGGHTAIVEFLVEKGANVNQSSTYNKSPLYKATRLRHSSNRRPLDIVQYLIQKGADINKCTKSNKSPLFGASGRGHFYVVKLLVQKGNDVNQCNTKTESPLYKASEKGHINVVEYLVHQGANVNQCNIKDQSPLYRACEGGHTAIVKYLVDNGADVNQFDTDNKSPLYKACERGHKAVVEFLVRQGADVHQCDTYNKTPLYRASEGGYKVVVEFLVDNGADVNQCDTDNISPLYKACKGGHKDVVEFLVDNKAVVRICDKNNQSPLYKACEGGHKAAVEFLVEHEADVHLCDKDDKSPLYKASEGGHKSVVEFLVGQGADVHHCDKHGKSPLYKAFEGGHKAIVEFLVQKGADIRQCDTLDQSLLYEASTRTHFFERVIVEKGDDIS